MPFRLCRRRRQRGRAGQWPGQRIQGEQCHNRNKSSLLSALVKDTTPRKTIQTRQDRAGHDNVGKPILQPIPKLPAKHLPAANALCRAAATAPTAAPPPLEYCTSPPPFQSRSNKRTNTRIVPAAAADASASRTAAAAAQHRVLHGHVCHPSP